MTRVLIDANVLYPTVLREIVLGVASCGLFTPLWSPRILEEWARAAARTGDEAVARGEIALVRSQWPDAEITTGAHPDLSLPDPDDTHVLGAAIDGRADELLTMNLRDFPTRILTQHGIIRREPDGFLLEFLGSDPAPVRDVVAGVHATAERLSGQPIPLRSLLKRARLPRLGKALG